MRREDLRTVVRYTPTSPDAEGLVCFMRVAETDLYAEIERHIAHFRAANVAFEWKVYDSDEPASLRDRLRSAGFEEGEPESLMVYETRKFTAASAPPADVQIVRIDREAKLGELVRLQERVWNRSFEWLLDMLQKMWSCTSFYAAYHQEHLVGAGWIEYPEGSRFAELRGGAVLPAFRRRGIYSRLWQSRMRDGLERGVEWVAVEAAPMSRPILEAKGFREIDRTYPMRWRYQLRPYNRTRQQTDQMATRHPRRPLALLEGPQISSL